MIEYVELLIDEKTLKQLETNKRHQYMLYFPNEHVQAPKTPHNQREQQPG